MTNLPNPREFLKYVDIADLHAKISDFRKLNFRDMTDVQIGNAVLKVLIVDTPQGPRTTGFLAWSEYPAGTKFFRVRTIADGDHIWPLKSMSLIGDCWEPPSSIVKKQRLNKDGEPLLYTTPINHKIPIEELKIPDDKFFSLIVYEAISPIKVIVIGAEPPQNQGFSKEELLKLVMLKDFLLHEFVRDVGIGTEYLYKISESIAKYFFDTPVEDAWCYPSIANKDCYNVCFKPGKTNKLKLIGVQISKVSCSSNNFLFKTYATAIPSIDGINLECFPIGSEEQLRVFPEIIQAEHTATG